MNYNDIKKNIKLPEAMLLPMVIDFLSDATVNVSEDNNFLLKEFILYNDFEIANLIIKHDNFKHLTSCGNFTPRNVFCEAIENSIYTDDLNALKYIYEYKEVYFKDYDHSDVILNAIYYNRVKIFDFLIEKNINVNVLDNVAIELFCTRKNKTSQIIFEKICLFSKNDSNIINILEKKNELELKNIAENIFRKKNLFNELNKNMDFHENTIKEKNKV